MARMIVAESFPAGLFQSPPGMEKRDFRYRSYLSDYFTVME